MLGACATSQSEIVKPVYPAAPAFLTPVEIPLVYKGVNSKVALAQNRAALIKANNNLIQSRDWYDDLTK